MMNLKIHFVTVVVVVICSAQTTQSRGMSLLDLVHARAEALRTKNDVTSVVNQDQTTLAPETKSTSEPVTEKYIAHTETERRYINAAVDNTNVPTGSTITMSTTETLVAPGKANICDTMCPRWCRIGSLEEGLLDCHYKCLRLCDQRATATNPFIGNADYEVIESQFNFDHYDINRDKRISVDEFMQTEIITATEIMDVFRFADADGDGYINVDEFTGGPLVFTVQMASEMNQLTRETNQTAPEPDMGRV